MAKLASCVLVLLAAVFVAEGVNIPAQPLWSPGKFRARSQIPSKIKPNDPRCTKNGVFPNKEDCTAFFVCKDGTSQERKCPEGMKFDSESHCTFDEKADCGRSTQGKSGDRVKCPEQNGYFPYPEDCHKYILCIDGMANIRVCPNKQWYQHNTGCVEGKKCPQSSQRANRRTNQLTEVMEN